MHILIIPSEEFLPPSSHMAGIFQYHQAKALVQAGHRVRVLSVSQSLSIPMIIKSMLGLLIGRPQHPALSGKGFRELVSLLYRKSFRPASFISKEEIDGIPVFRVDGFYFLPPSKHTNHMGWIQAGYSVWERYQQEEGNPDIIHAHNVVYAGMLARKIHRASGIPYVVTEHSSFLMRNLESGRIQAAIRASMEEAAIVLPVSPALEKSLHRLYGKNFRSRPLPNVLDPQVEFAPMPVVDRQNGQPFTFLIIASMIPLKRHSDLIDAFAQAFGDGTPARLMIGGDGDLAPALKKQVIDRGIADQVVFLGKLDRQQVINAIDDGDCLVVTSEIETFGVVLIEALSRGKPLIASRCGGPESVVHAGNGILYQTGDIAGLAAALRQMLEKGHSFDPLALRREAMDNYGQRAFVSELEKIYREINN